MWAFGAVLYEMLTGQRAFAGEDVSDTLANVLKMEPDWERVPANLPVRVRQVMRACLQKNVKQRIGDVQGMRLALDGAFETAAPQAAVSAVAPRRWVARAAFAFGAVALASLASTAILYRRPAPVETPSIQFIVSPPEGWSTTAFASSLAMSPDGRRLAFVATDKDGQRLIWVRSLDATVAQPLKGTETALVPNWSPDSKFLVFAAGGKLKKIDVAGGPPQTIADVAAIAGGWSPDGTILL